MKQLKNIAILLLAMICLAASQDEATTCLYQSKNPVGDFIPKCNATTHHFLSKQCDNNVGMCWCVEIYSGHMMVGTDGPKSDFNIDCNSFKGTKCEQELHEKYKLEEQGKVTHIPDCNVYDGSYMPKQCNPFISKCWCVDKHTGVKNGTYWSSINPKIDCVRTFPENKEMFHITKTTCQNQTESIAGEFIPKCNATTHLFVPKQCDSNTDNCWCAEIYSGRIMAGTSMLTSDFNIDCDSHKGTKCEQELHESYQQREQGKYAFVPECDIYDGFYLPKQCNSSNGKCWCVDKHTGVRIGTESFDTNAKIDCVDTFPEIDQTPSKFTTCLYQSRNPSRDFVPTCSATTHHFIPKQCDNNTGVCWCVEIYSGRKMVGTDGPKSDFNIDCDSHEGTNCEQELHESNHQWDLGNYGHVPKCNKDGSYQAKQCDLFAFKCWCAEKHTGVKNGPDWSFFVNTKIDCVKTFPENEQTKTDCQHQQTADPPREFIPTCNATTHLFEPRQCDNKTGICWCAEIYSGRIMAGTVEIESDFNIDCDSHKGTNCEQELHESYRLENQGKNTRFPLCDYISGNYSPKQCDYSNGTCWCSDEHSGIIIGPDPFDQNANVDCVNTIVQINQMSQAAKLRGWIRSLEEITKYLNEELNKMDSSSQ